MRPYTTGDQAAVLGLVNRDRLTGQPQTTPGMLADALAGRSHIDAGWWEDLDVPSTDVAVDAAGTITGVISYTVRQSDRTGLILWLHCGEDQATATALINHACARLAPRPIRAFDFASALTLGLEGLPAHHRPATHRALLQAGFTDHDIWRYMHRTLTAAKAAELPQASECVMSPDPDVEGTLLQIYRAGTVIATATVGRPVDGIGVLWWISVEPQARGLGLGRQLIGSALCELAALGADQVVLYVDDNTPDGDDRTAANHLYDTTGFSQIDRLHSYTRRGRRFPRITGLWKTAS